MILTIVITFLATFAAVFIGGFLLYFIIKKRLNVLIQDIIYSPDEKTPSKFASFVDTISFVFSQRLVSQLKATVMGMNSVDSKNALKEKSESIVGNSPALSAILNLIPGAKRLLKSPELLAYAAGKLGGNGKKEPDVQEQKSKILFPF